MLNSSSFESTLTPAWNRLIDFFRYYSRDFLYNTCVASIRTGLIKKESKGWQNDVCIVSLVWNRTETSRQLSARYNDARERNRFCIEVRILHSSTFVFLLPCTGSIWDWLQRFSLRDQRWSLHCGHKRSLWIRLLSTDEYFYRYVVNSCVPPEFLQLALIGLLLPWLSFAKKGRMRNSLLHLHMSPDRLHCPPKHPIRWEIKLCGQR